VALPITVTRLFALKTKSQFFGLSLLSVSIAEAHTEVHTDFQLYR
jgi:hypothetical protein